MPKCQKCATQLKGLLKITSNKLGFQCPKCFEFHNWYDGKLIMEVKKNSKTNSM